MRHVQTGDDHLLLAMAMGNDQAAEIIVRWVSAHAMHHQVNEAHEVQEQLTAPPELSAGATHALERARHHAYRLGRHQIDTVALLLGILERNDHAVQALSALGVDVAEMARDVELTATEQPAQEVIEAAVVHEETATASSMATEAASRPVRPWPSPRCQGCHKLIRDHVQLRTLDVPDETTGEVERFRFLYCGSCGTAFAIERIKD